MKKGTEDVVYNIEDLERPARGETGELVCGNHQVEGKGIRRYQCRSLPVGRKKREWQFSL